MDDEIFVRIVILLIFALLIGWLGSKRRIGFVWAFLASLFLSPILGLIITLCSKKNQPDFDDVTKNDMQ